MAVFGAAAENEIEGEHGIEISEGAANIHQRAVDPVVFRFDHLKPFGFEKATREISDQTLVVHDENEGRGGRRDRHEPFSSNLAADWDLWH